MVPRCGSRYRQLGSNRFREGPGACLLKNGCGPKNAHPVIQQKDERKNFLYHQFYPFLSVCYHRSAAATEGPQILSLSLCGFDFMHDWRCLSGSTCLFRRASEVKEGRFWLARKPAAPSAARPTRWPHRPRRKGRWPQRKPASSSL